EQQLNLCIPLTEATVNKENNLVVSKFVTAIENNVSSNKDFPIQESHPALTELYLSTLVKKPVLRDEFLDQRLINNALKTFTLSATTLNRYLNCKLSFYFEQVLKVPTAKSSALAFGSMIHNVLEEVFKYINANRHTPNYEFVKLEFERQVDRYRFSFNERQFEKRKQQGYKVIEEYYNNYAHTWDTTKFYHIEKEMKGYFEKIPIFGKLDNIEVSNNQAFVVDYKTGNPDNSLKKLYKPSEKDPLGGDIWRQVIFYQILLTSSKYKFPMAHGIVDFVEKSRRDNKFIREKIVPDLESIEVVKDQIRMVWQGIQSQDFHTGCGDAKCVWCNFVKDNYRNLKFIEDDGETVVEEL
ncbi:MAG TPA: PD-(D/E)XK nuclease family protein, partial [Cytophagales bacterium]|nr:PD-(D/E)XK nuclease family protein [Cytophagales bacterium]